MSLISANAGLQVFVIHTCQEEDDPIKSVLQAEKEAAMKQAESASRAAESLMASAGEKSSDTADVKELKEALEKATKEAEVAKKDVNSMKSQSESLAKEYDRYVFVLFLSGY